MMKTVEHPRIPLRGAEVWPLSVAAYRARGEAGLIPKNTELLYGFVYTKISKSPLHSALVRQLIRLLEQAALSDCFLSGEQPVSCEDSEPEPDIALIQGREEDFRHEHPRPAELVIEVCGTSHDYDRSKLRAYASAGVKECWLVLGPEKQIEVHRQPSEGAYVEQTLHGPGGHLGCAALPGFTVDMDAIFVK